MEARSRRSVPRPAAGRTGAVRRRPGGRRRAGTGVGVRRRTHAGRHAARPAARFDRAARAARHRVVARRAAAVPRVPRPDPRALGTWFAEGPAFAGPSVVSAVEQVHRTFGVAGTGDVGRGYGGVERGELGRGQPYVGGG